MKPQALALLLGITVEWDQLAAMVTVSGFLCGAALVYLRLFLASALHRHRDDVLRAVEHLAERSWLSLRDADEIRRSVGELDARVRLLEGRRVE